MRFRSVVPWADYERTGSDYEDPAFLQEHAPLFPPAGMMAREELLAATTYSRAPPRHLFGPDAAFLEELRAAHLDWIARMKMSPPVVRCRLERALILGGAMLSQAAGDTCGIWETLRFNDRAFTPMARAEAAPDWSRALRMPVAGFLGSAGSFNYGHWLIDDLPRAPLYQNRLLVLPDYGQRMNAVRREGVALVAPRAECLFAPPDEFLAFERLEYVSPTSFHPHLKTAPLLHALRDRVAGPAAARAGHRLFAPRFSGARQLDNLDAVRDRLEAKGFETIDVDEMSFAEQAAAFASAEAVIGTMGASMTNTVFCRSGARIGHLAPAGWVEPFYWDLAAAMGHDYAVAFGESASAGKPHLSDFTLELDDVDRLVRWTLTGAAQPMIPTSSGAGGRQRAQAVWPTRRRPRA